jgi:glucose-6-phosphate 1-dehydrogenase
MSEEKVLHPTTIIIFGATGDLAKRKLFPAFYNLYIDGRMPENFNIIALGRSENTNKNFRNYVVENLENFSRKKEHQKTGLASNLISRIFSISWIRKIPTRH